MPLRRMRSARLQPSRSGRRGMCMFHPTPRRSDLCVSRRSWSGVRYLPRSSRPAACARHSLRRRPYGTLPLSPWDSKRPARHHRRQRSRTCCPRRRPGSAFRPGKSPAAPDAYGGTHVPVDRIPGLGFARVVLRPLEGKEPLVGAGLGRGGVGALEHAP